MAWSEEEEDTFFIRWSVKESAKSWEAQYYLKPPINIIVLFGGGVAPRYSYITLYARQLENIVIDVIFVLF